MSTKPALPANASSKTTSSATSGAKAGATKKPTTSPVTGKPASAKPVAKKPVSTAKPASPKVAPKPATISNIVVAAEKTKTEKVKMERDSFTMPKEEYAQIAALKKRLDALGKPAKKSELLRAGLKLLSGLSDAALQASLNAIPTIKTGRPKKKH